MKHGRRRARLNDVAELIGGGIVVRQVQAAHIDLYYGVRDLLVDGDRHIAEIRSFDCTRVALDIGLGLECIKGDVLGVESLAGVY